MVLVALLCFDTLVKLYIQKMRVFMIRPWPEHCLHYLGFFHQVVIITCLKYTILSVAVAVSCAWMAGVLDLCWCPGWSCRISDHLLDVVWQSSLSPVSLESRCTCAFYRSEALSAHAWNQFFLVRPGRTRPLFVPDMWLWESVAVATQSSAFPCFHPPETQTFVVAWVDFTAVFLFSSCCVVFTTHVLSD